MAAFLRFGLSGEAVVAAIFAGVLVVLAAIDIERRIVPNRIVLPARCPRAGRELPGLPRSALEFFVAALGAGLILLLPLLVYPAGMGKGDVKLAMLLGAGLGAQVVSAFVVGFLTAFIFAVGILAVRGGAAPQAGRSPSCRS